MLIAIVGTRGVPASYGGFETLAENLSLELAYLGHEVIVTGFTEKKGMTFETFLDNISSLKVKIVGPRYMQNFLVSRKASKYLMRDFDLDAVIVLNDVNYFAAREFSKNSVLTLLHLDGDESERSGLPKIGRIVHQIFRYFAKKSDIHLIVDSQYICDSLGVDSKRISVIKYAPHVALPIKPAYQEFRITSHAFFLLVARLVPENQILEVINAYKMSGINESLVVVGLGTGREGYEARILSSSSDYENIHVLPKNYDRSQINWLLQNAKGYIHGHSVGGTNPILVDARLHAKLILSHDNPYNREDSGHKEHFWINDDQLTNLLKGIDSLEMGDEVGGYSLGAWETIAWQYLELLNNRK